MKTVATPSEPRLTSELRRRQRLTAETRSFATSLKELRTQKLLSLQELAGRADVSKSMISKIERNDVQPSLDVALRLAMALKVTLAEMLRSDQYESPHLIEREKQAVIRSDEGGWDRRMLSPSFKAKNIELVYGRLGPHKHVGEALTHPAGSEEYVAVLKGTLKITVGSRSYVLRQGDSFFFEADQRHSLVNPAARETEFIVVIKFAN
jgi:transcriptional regulator with XRE-family HTH domain